jgi:hypothetical protein
MKFKPNRIIGLTFTIMLASVLFMAAIPLPVYSADAWADSTCKYRLKITFKNSGSSTSLSNFPVLIVLNSSVIDYSKTSRKDIRFYDGSTLLDKDIERWDSGGNSYIWVNVPTIPNTNAGYIYAYYGSSDSGSPEYTTDVWDSSFAMVLHLNDTGTRKDSTSNHNNGNPHGDKLTHQTTGHIAGYDDFAGTGNTTASEAYIITQNAASLNFAYGSFSYSFWFYARARDTRDILDKRGGAAGDPYAGYKITIATDTTPPTPQKGFSPSLGDGTNNIRLDTGDDPSRNPGNVWAMMTVVVDRKADHSGKIIAYINGAWKAEKAIGTSFGSVDNSNNLWLGRNLRATDRYYNGLLDEVRISNVARSADWIKADYLSTKNQFINFGIDSCDSLGVKKDTFDPSDTIYLHSLGLGGYAKSTSYPLYVVSDTTWTDGMTMPTRIPSTATSVTSDSSGNIPVTGIWSPTLTPGKYDIVIDVNGDGKYNLGVDVLDDGDVVSTAGFFVIPEYAVGTILALAVCFGGVFVYRKYRNGKQKPI